MLLLAREHSCYGTTGQSKLDFTTAMGLVFLTYFYGGVFKQYINMYTDEIGRLIYLNIKLLETFISAGAANNDSDILKRNF